MKRSLLRIAVGNFLLVIILGHFGAPLFAQDQPALLPDFDLTARGGAFEFSRFDTAMNLGTSGVLDLAGGEFTVRAWVRFASPCNVDFYWCDMPIASNIAAPAAQPNEHGWHLLRQNDNHFWFCLGGGDRVNGCTADAATTVRSLTMPANGVWYDVAGVKSSNRITIYVNGVLEGTTTLGPHSDASTAPLLIGAGHEGFFLNGQVAQVQLYKSALTEPLLRALHESSNPALAGAGLVAYWQFSNGSTADLSGNHNDGEAIGAVPATDRLWVPNDAYRFDGADDYIMVANSPSLQIGTGDYTIAAWIKTGVSSYGRIFSKGSWGCTTGYMMRLDGDKVLLENASNGSCLVRFPGSTTVTDGSWHFVAGVVDRRAGGAIYVDGVLDAKQMIDTSAYDLSNDRTPTIGAIDMVVDRPVGYPDEFFNGKIDEVRVYNRALSPGEIRALFDASKPLGNY
jgi:hypothetical protein